MEKNYKKIELKKDNKYKICTCGTSKIIPFCDDSHMVLNEKKGTNYKSLKLIPRENIEIKIKSKNWKNES